jgi:hypothetical protein
MRTDMRTFTDDRDDLRRGTKFLAVLLAIPLAGLLGLPLLLSLVLLFWFNPANLGLRIGRYRPLRRIPGFRSGRRTHMAIASLLYLLPLSTLGIVVISIDGIVLGMHL